MLQRFKCYQPPISNDPSMSQQQSLKHTTILELKKLRKPPKYTFLQTLAQLGMFLIFGIVKAVASLSYCLIAGSFLAVLVTVWKAVGAPESWRIPIKRLWAATARILLFLLGFYKINFHGQPDSDSRFLISNHTCFFDGWLFLPLLPRPLDKKELLNIPFIKEMWEVFDGICVDRTKSCGMTKVLVANASNSNQPMIQMFPEGATTNGDYMLRFHLGAFLSDLPLQPVAIRYTLWGTSKKIAHLSWFHNYPRQWLAFLSIPMITVDIYFLETVSLKITQQNEPRRFADEVSVTIANFLGVPVLDLTSSAIYKQNVIKKND